MNIRYLFVSLPAILFLAAGTGCQKDASDRSSTTPTQLSPDTAASVHWLGKKRLGIEASAYYLMRIWGLPETKQLEAQTLNKLSIAPWRLFGGEQAPTNALSPYVENLLADIVQEECYLEVRAPTNKPGEAVFALKLSADRAGVWETNLAAILQASTGIPVLYSEHGGWIVRRPTAPTLIEFARVGEWTLIGLAQEKNPLMDEISTRIRRDRGPFTGSSSNFWLEATLNSALAARIFDVPQAVAWPNLHLVVDGDGANSQLKGELTFSQPLQIQNESWIIPTNLIHQPISRFTALRGFGPWLDSQKLWRELGFSAAPHQLFFWEPEDIPMQMYFAAAQTGASESIRGLTGPWLKTGNAWLATNGIGSLSPLQNSNGVSWTGLPLISPFCTAATVANNEFIFGGMISTNDSNANPPPVLPWDLLGRTNVVFYDWEATGTRLESWAYLGQLLRIAFHHPPLPVDSISASWFRALSPRLATSRTVIRSEGPNTLSFERKATIGFTAAELQLLVDWLESPRFPVGLFSLVVPASSVQVQTAPDSSGVKAP